MNTIIHILVLLKWSLLISSTYIDSGVENKNRDSKFEFREPARISNVKTLLQNVTLHIGLGKILWLNKLTIVWGGHMLLVI